LPLSKSQRSPLVSRGAGTGVLEVDGERLKARVFRWVLILGLLASLAPTCRATCPSIRMIALEEARSGRSPDLGAGRLLLGAAAVRQRLSGTGLYVAASSGVLLRSPRRLAEPEAPRQLGGGDPGRVRVLTPQC